MRVVALLSIFALGSCQDNDSLSLLQTSASVKEHSFGTGRTECKAALALAKEKKAEQKTLKASFKAAREALKTAKAAFVAGKSEASTASDAIADACPDRAPKAVEGEISGTIIQEDGTYSSQFAAKNVLDPTWQGGSHNNGQTWLTSGCNNGWFIMKLQETCVVKEFHLLNTCNTPYNDRSTNKFSIYLSEDNVNWELAMSGELERCAHIQGEPLVFDNPTKKKSQFVKFKMDQCYQASGGLNYFQAFR